LYMYPEISLYLGNNYFQLGESVKARTDLLRYYNGCPEKNSHLILTKVGDTYLDEGEIGNAVKYYYLVLKRYPKSEGAIISKIRLAEQQEKGNVGGNLPEKISSPKKIYEEIIDNFRENSLGHPFEQLAMLRLAKIYEDNEDYNKSLEYLKNFLKKYPRSSLKKEAQHSFNNVIGKILNIELKAGRYYNILDIYEREKNAILQADSAYPYLPIARAFMHLSFDDMSANIFTMADKLLPEMEKPSDLLYSLSMDNFKKRKYEEALSYINTLIKNYPDNSLTPYAYKLKGKIFFKQRKYSLAEDFFKLALKFNLNPYEKLLHSVRNDNILRFGCKSFYSQIYQDIGDLNLHVRDTKNALEAFKQALDFEESEENKTLLLIKIAKCYKLLNKKDDYLPIYEQIASLENVWSNIAKYEIEGIDFHDKIIKKGIE
ncbi:MAG: tetratricopeptide repeat protein, partial [Deltaproteobacteria bacterium]|nr:tetratricopeptide repeat protein [Deltaproteobacteria bacterium]